MESHRLDGRIAFVTGAGSGLGREIALAFARAGARVAVNDLRPKAAKSVHEELRGLGGALPCGPLIGDVSESSAVAGWFAVLAGATGGQLDVMVNNAGFADTDPETEERTRAQVTEMMQTGRVTTSLEATSRLSDERWQRMLRVHLDGAFHGTREALRLMQPRRSGRVINIASIAGVRPLPNLTPAYAASKASLIMTSLSMAMTVAGTGVTVNCLTPGFVATDALADFVLSTPGNEGKTWDEVESATAIGWRIAVGRFGRPKDIAGLITYLASPMADWITGSNFRIDGGTADWVG